MSTGTYVPITCAGCHQPILDASFIWNGSGCYHNHCRPPGYLIPPASAQLTEDRVRQIVREELARNVGVMGKENDRG